MNIRIGIVGAGGICRSKHVPNFRKIQGVEIVAVCNRSEESGRKFAGEFGIPGVETNWKKLVAREDLNAIVIGTWPNLHRDVTLAALKAGKHVLCESRMAWDAKHAREMLAASKAAKKRGLRTMLCPPPTGFRGDYVMKRLIKDGVLGKPVQLYVRHMGGGLLNPATPIIWRQIRKFQGVNALTLGMLNEPVQRWFGDTLNVMARTRIVTKKRPVEAGGAKLQKVERPDLISILAEKKNGMQATYMFSSVALQAGENVVEAFGTAGMIRYSLDSHKIWTAKVGGEYREVPYTDAEARHWEVEQDFVNAIRNGSPVTPSFEEGVKYMEFSEAVERSDQTGKAIPISRR
ncbi:MAG: Gfo/Idh/MocA family oxidoreductase [Planctomycetota bacterium]|nr:Gfo/Idh/MocA family oxidoreductase [Planctomycetota bacterium]